MQRKQSEICSILKYKEHYLNKILESFVGKDLEKRIKK